MAMEAVVWFLKQLQKYNNNIQQLITFSFRLTSCIPSNLIEILMCKQYVPPTVYTDLKAVCVVNRYLSVLSNGKIKIQTKQTNGQQLSYC